MGYIVKVKGHPIYWTGEKTTFKKSDAKVYSEDRWAAKGRVACERRTGINRNRLERVEI